MCHEGRHNSRDKMLRSSGDMSILVPGLRVWAPLIGSGEQLNVFVEFSENECKVSFSHRKMHQSSSITWKG